MFMYVDYNMWQGLRRIEFNMGRIIFGGKYIALEEDTGVGRQIDGSVENLDSVINSVMENVCK